MVGAGGCGCDELRGKDSICHFGPRSNCAQMLSQLWSWDGSDPSPRWNGDVGKVFSERACSDFELMLVCEADSDLRFRQWLRIKSAIQRANSMKIGSDEAYRLALLRLSCSPMPS